MSLGKYEWRPRIPRLDIIYFMIYKIALALYFSNLQFILINSISYCVW